MSIRAGINKMRRHLMRGLTKKLGRSRVDTRNTSPDAITRILVCRTNHRLGNLLLITPLLAEIEGLLPHAKIDLFVKGYISPVLFKNFPQVDRIVQLPKKPMKHLFRYVGGWLTVLTRRYDVAINVVYNSSSGRISTRLANARSKFLGEADENVQLPPDYEHMAKFPVYGFRAFIKRLGVKGADGPVPSLSIRLTPAEMGEGKKILAGLVRGPRPIVALYTFATGAKCYDEGWWTTFYEKLKTRFSDAHIIEVLPIENVSQIAFQAPSFYSKDLRKIAALIRNVDVFIGADSGMMHLASASGTPVIGLFKAQNMHTYEPYNKGSAGINTNEISLDDLVEAVAFRLSITREQ